MRRETICENIGRFCDGATVSHEVDDALRLAETPGWCLRKNLDLGRSWGTPKMAFSVPRDFHGNSSANAVVMGKFD